MLSCCKECEERVKGKKKKWVRNKKKKGRKKKRLVCILLGMPQSRRFLFKWALIPGVGRLLSLTSQISDLDRDTLDDRWRLCGESSAGDWMPPKYPPCMFVVKTKEEENRLSCRLESRRGAAKQQPAILTTKSNICFRFRPKRKPWGGGIFPTANVNIRLYKIQSRSYSFSSFVFVFYFIFFCWHMSNLFSHHRILVCRFDVVSIDTVLLNRLPW